MQHSRSSFSCAQINLNTCFHLHSFTPRSQPTASLETNPLKTQAASSSPHLVNLQLWNYGSHLWNDWTLITPQRSPPKCVCGFKRVRFSHVQRWIKHFSPGKTKDNSRLFSGEVLDQKVINVTESPRSSFFRWFRPNFFSEKNTQSQWATGRGVS